MCRMFSGCLADYNMFVSFLFLYSYLPVAYGNTCQPHVSEDEKTMFSSGDIILGGLFPIHNSAMEQNSVLKWFPPEVVCTT